MITPPDILAGRKDNIALTKPLVGKINIPKINNKNKRVLEHVVKLYGVTKEGYSVSVNNTGFKPYFYIKVGDISFVQKTKLIEKIKTCLEEKKRIF